MSALLALSVAIAGWGVAAAAAEDALATRAHQVLTVAREHASSPGADCPDPVAPAPGAVSHLEQAVSAAVRTAALPATHQILQFHGDESHGGVIVDPGMTRAAAPTLQLDAGFKARVDGPSYSQPLYVKDGAGPGRDAVLVTTEKNRAYAFDAKTGATLWSTGVGDPVPLSSLECGNIDPLGVTGTPAVDPEGQAIYFDAMTTPDGGKTKHHELFALSVRDGKLLPGFPIDVAIALKAVLPKGESFKAEYQNQRSAVLIHAGRVFFAYGGHWGDCGNYHGWVLSLPLGARPSREALAAKDLKYWKTTAPDGGVWAPGGPVSDGKSIYFATGNTDETQAWAGGESVIRLDPELRSRGTVDYYTPRNWKQLDDDDIDIGGTSPLVFTLPGSGGPGAKPRKLVSAMGKDGVVYLLDGENLGGIGHELSSHKISSPIITSPVAYTTPNGTYLVFKGRSSECPARQSGDLTAVKVLPGAKPGAPPTTQVAWCADQGGNGSPVVTTTDGERESVVWSIGAEGDNRLRAFDGETGKLIFKGPEQPDAVSRYQTPLVVGGQLYIVTDRKLVRYARPE